jgi:hypothetical protein
MLNKIKNYIASKLYTPPDIASWEVKSKVNCENCGSKDTVYNMRNCSLVCTRCTKYKVL